MPEPEISEARDIVTKTSPYSVAETVTRFTRAITSGGLTLFGVIDQAAEARRHGLDLRDTVLVLFGDPRSGTPLMQAAPLAALDLPLKVVIWDDASETRITYLAPMALGARYHLDPSLLTALTGIHRLTDSIATTPSRATE